MIAAFFDFDGTLYTGHIWQDLARHHWKARAHRRWVVAYVVRNMAPMPFFRAGWVSQEAYFRKWGETMAWLVRGWTVEDGQALFEQLTDEQIMPNLRADVLSQLGQHQAQGHLVALVSGTFAPWLGTVARRLGVPHAIGTPLHVRDGRYTGRIIPPLCLGEGKSTRVQDYVAERGLDVDWEASFAFADRISDVPLLSKVGWPVAVYPDEELQAKARREGWTITGEVT
jgi:putative phosphoserine phosphatase/1-acylglycerol-3-phosphate O-acyltransferase